MTNLAASHPSVYLIILSWNQRENTLATIESVLKSDYPNFTAVVVDNASSDGTVEAVRAAYPDIKLIVTERNLMYAGGNNVGIRFALDSGADWVALLNNDIEVEPSMVRELVGAAIETGAGMAGPMMYYYPPRGAGSEIIWYAGGWVSYWLGMTAHRGIRAIDRGQYTRVTDTDYISGCVVVARRDVIEKIGMLDEGFYIYAEDADWCIRAARAGYRLVFVPTARMWHKVSVSSGGGLTQFKVYWKLRSGIRLFMKHARPWHWLTIPAFIIAGNMAFLLKCLVSGNMKDARTFIKGLFAPK